MPPELEATGGPAPDMWQSLDQWMDTPQFRDMMRDEFPEDADTWLDPVSRRHPAAGHAAAVKIGFPASPTRGEEAHCLRVDRRQT